MHPRIENTFLWLAELGLAVLPRQAPSAAQLSRARIVAHRGERDGVRVRENTLAAFDPVVAAGVGAIEFDIRYTRDDEPVVVHDADLRRVFGYSDRIDALSWRALRARVPELPHLAEILDRYADTTHLMIELKTRGSKRAEARMHDQLAALTPRDDYHILSLEPELFHAVAALPSDTRIPVAKTNWSAIRAWSRVHDCGGLAGFYLMIRDADVADSRRRNRLIGSGFINRGGLMLREIARDIPWVFSNRPLALQRRLDRARRRVGFS